MIYSDIELSRKLERAEGQACADFVRTRARLNPEHGSAWMDFDGVYAMYDGANSPCTQTFGLGLFGSTSDANLEQIETYFTDRDAPVLHEVSPMADPSILAMLNDRGYQPVELTTVMYRPLEVDRAGVREGNPAITTRVVSSDEADLWARTSGGGWASEQQGSPDFMYGFGMISARCEGAYPYLAQLNGDPVATGMLFIYGDVAMLAGASTIPEGRNNGAQSALLSARLSFAAQSGCTLAVMGAAPGSQSQKNAQRNGFSIAYTRIKWHLVV